LAEARSIWATGGAVVGLARTEVAIGRLADADATERCGGRDALRTLQRLGIRDTDDRSTGAGSGTMVVTVLGPFGVCVDGVAVPLPSWRSKQARTLVKILVAHRGRVVSRDRLCDLLWPDDDPARTGHRLSVLLATVRSVLDPARSWPPDRYLVADQSGVRLNREAAVVDAELLVQDATYAAELLEGSDPGPAREVLDHLDSCRRGEAFEDECDEWADELREEVRAAWARSMRRLANLRLRAGQGPDALGIFTRLLAVDPYDEAIHRRLVGCLVRAGRHGEARRAFDRWCRAMIEIDAPLPDPAEVDLDNGVVEPVLTPR
jgi:DNA-binding SARP family transcriptional activator